MFPCCSSSPCWLPSSSGLRRRKGEGSKAYRQIEKAYAYWQNVAKQKEAAKRAAENMRLTKKEVFMESQMRSQAVKGGYDKGWQAESLRWEGLAKQEAAIVNSKQSTTSLLQNAWNTWIQPALENTANFVSGVVYQAVIRNNLDSLMSIAPAPVSVKLKWFDSWDGFESHSTVSNTAAFKAGKIVGGFLGIAQGIIEIGSGLATATGGTFVSCGTVILCFEGGGASLAIGGALVAHGVLVAGTAAVETSLAIRSLASSSDSSGGARAKIGDSILGKKNTAYIKTKTAKGANRDYEVRVTGKPNPELAIKVNGTEFDWYEGDTLIDAKNAGETRSWYDVSKLDGFTQTVKVENVVAQAQRQINAMQGSGFTNIEWRVADSRVAEALNSLFASEFPSGIIRAVYCP